jgi:regulator of cell morphogenesis and NO signaling
MLSKNSDVRGDNYVTDLVVKDFRTARVFRKYGIDYCCGGRIPLQLACEIGGLNTASVKVELTDAMRNINISNSTNFNEWNIEFLSTTLLTFITLTSTTILKKQLTLLNGFLKDTKRNIRFLRTAVILCAAALR